MIKMNLYTIVALLLTIIFFGCKDKNEEDKSIGLDKKIFTIGIEGGEEIVMLTAESEWKIDDLPDWITVDPVQGNKSTKLTITVKRQNEADGRWFNILFIDKNEDVRNIFRVEQSGKKDYERIPILPTSSLERIQVDNGTDYKIEARSLFVNPTIKDKIYLGNLVGHVATNYPDLSTFTGYTFNPITISTTAAIDGNIVKTYVPSRAEQDKFVREIVAEKIKQTDSWLGNNGTVEFYSYKQLYALGIANMGIKLDEVVSGASYTEKEMAKKYGLIFSFKQVFFSLIMDLPEKLIQGELKASDKASDISYVSSVQYGKIGLLIVESDTNSEVIRVLINKVLSDQSLSAEEAALIDSTNICYVYLDNNSEVQTVKERFGAINAYKNTGKETDNIYPVGFELSNFEDSSFSMISFSFQVAK